LPRNLVMYNRQICNLKQLKKFDEIYLLINIKTDFYKIKYKLIYSRMCFQFIRYYEMLLIEGKDYFLVMSKMRVCRDR